MGHLDKNQRAAIGDGLEASLEELTARVEALQAQVERERCANAVEKQVLNESISILETRLLRVENSLLFRFNRAVGNFVQIKGRRAAGTLRHRAFDVFRWRQLKAADEVYARWIGFQEETLRNPSSHPGRKTLWTWQPRFDILLATRNPKREWLAGAIASVQNQTYGNWRLCICDDASEESWVAGYLKSVADEDVRGTISILPSPRGMSESLNEAFRLGTGDFIACLRQDGLLHPRCLQEIGEACQDGLQVVYVDEDHIDELGRRRQPRFKPDWSPDLLTSCMYWGQFWAVDRKVMEEAASSPEQWFRPAFDGAEGYDLALRLTDLRVKVGHVSRVLYHSFSPRKDDASDLNKASRLAVEAAIDRRGWPGTADSGSTPDTFFIHRKLRNRPLVSIVVCSRELKLFEPFLRNLAEVTDYDLIELVLVEHRTGPKGFPLERLRKIWTKPWVHMTHSGAFNFSIMNNRGAQAATGSVLVFLNDDVVPLRRDWLTRMVSQIQRSEVGIAGARLEYPSGAIQHAGIALGMSLDGAGHPGRFLFESDLFPWLKVTRNVSAVTGACFAIRRNVYEELGGMDIQFPVDYNDVDLCLRARERGYLIVFEAGAVLRHFESASRGGESRFRERTIFLKRWAHLLQAPDPYVPAAIDRRTEAIRLGFGQSIGMPIE